MKKIAIIGAGISGLFIANLFEKNAKRFPSSYWFDKRKLDNYMLPTFTKKVVKYLEKK